MSHRQPYQSYRQPSMSHMQSQESHGLPFYINVPPPSNQPASGRQPSRSMSDWQSQESYGQPSFSNLPLPSYESYGQPSPSSPYSQRSHKLYSSSSKNHATWQRNTDLQSPLNHSYAGNHSQSGMGPQRGVMLDSSVSQVHNGFLSNEDNRNFSAPSVHMQSLPMWGRPALATPPQSPTSARSMSCLCPLNAGRLFLR